MVYGGTAGAEQLQYVMHPEGVATKRVSGGFDWQYHLTDYMGNVRTVALADVNGLVPIQSTDYYAFGLAHGYENLHLNRFCSRARSCRMRGISSPPYYFTA